MLFIFFKKHWKIILRFKQKISFKITITGSVRVETSLLLDKLNFIIKYLNLNSSNIICCISLEPDPSYN